MFPKTEQDETRQKYEIFRESCRSCQNLNFVHVSINIITNLNFNNIVYALCVATEVV